MSLKNCNDANYWEATRRKFLKTLALFGGVSSVDLLAPFKENGFAKEGEMTSEEIRDKAIRVFRKRFH